MKKEYPVFLIKGILEAGKTQFIKEAVINDGFCSRGNTLLLLCEEGIEEYDEKNLTENYTTCHIFNSQEEFTKENLEKIVKEANPDRIIIEMNAMWDNEQIELPKSFIVVQSITFIDATTFKVYFNNMRQKFVDMVKDTDAVFFNRCSNMDELALYSKSLKLINPNCDYVYQTVDGEMITKLECDLPYDIKLDTLEINDNDFAIWYTDAIDNPDRYDGKKVVYSGQIINDESFPKGVVVVGRNVMTCCQDDIQFVGPYVVAKGVELEDYTWVRISAKINYEEDYDGRKVIILTCEELTKIRPLEQEVLSL